MDLEKDWELLPEEGFLEINDDGAGKKIYSRRYPSMFSATSTTITVFHMNYFICPPPPLQPPSPKSTLPEFIQFPKQHQLLPPVPINTNDLEQQDHHRAADTNITAEEKESSIGFDTDEDHHHHQDPAVSQVFFKKMKEITESVDTIKVIRGNQLPQIEGVAAGAEMGDPLPRKVNDSAEILAAGMMDLAGHKSEGEGEGQGGRGSLNSSIWKWSLTGVGAICSFGVVAAATLCVVILTTTSNPKLQFQIYTNDKVTKKTKLNDQAISAARGSVPITTARITFGGHYHASL